MTESRLRERVNNWYLTDPDSMQYCKDLGNGSYAFVQAIWLDTTQDDEHAPGAESESDNYVVVADTVRVSEMDRNEMETCVSGYYDGLDSMCERYDIPLMSLLDVVAECAFENQESYAYESPLLSRKNAEKRVMEYIQAN